MNFKRKVYESYNILLDTKIRSILDTLDALKESMTNETKSSAGDKYETGRAMLHIEQENSNKQLTEAREQKAILEKIDLTVFTGTIIKGSLVKTNRGYFFMSIALGKVIVDDITIIAVSPASPLGAKLLGLKIDGAAEINGLFYSIEDIV